MKRVVGNVYVCEMSLATKVLPVAYVRGLEHDLPHPMLLHIRSGIQAGIGCLLNRVAVGTDQRLNVYLVACTHAARVQCWSI